MKKFVLAAALVLLTLILAPVPASADPGDTSEALQDAVELDAIRAHQQVWQDIADANGGVRFASSPGYDLSADYVQAQLEAAGYDVERLSFDFDFFEEVGDSLFSQTAPVATDFVDQTDFDLMEYSGSGDVAAPVTAVDLSLVDRDASTSGCEADDFVGFPAGNIALVQRGACSFAAKAINAEAAGAVGIVIFNQGNTPDREGLLFGTIGGAGQITIPVVGTTFAVGEALTADGAAASLTASTLSEVRTTTNVIAQSTTGDPNSVVMAGAHLDSVPEGPGIQDNGTGSAAILEIALTLAEDFGVNDAGDDTLVNAVRFGWWGAEEFGLLGSIDYVVSLPPEELNKIAVYQNYDMIGSPNFVRYIYDGDNSEGANTIGSPDTSAVLEDVYADYFDSKGLATDSTVIGQRSDHFAFCVSGIACGGLFTGAEGIKTAEEVAIYGGTEGDQYDPCYHLACDTFDNISLEALDQMSDAAAHAVATYAFTPLCNGIPATILGTDGDDNITGTPGDDVIISYGGRDMVDGGRGNDTICLGDGNDVGTGGDGNDTIIGGAGLDTIRGGTGDDLIDGGDRPDQLFGGSGDDDIIGGGGADTIFGGSGNNIMSGGDGGDTITGGGDTDLADGGAGGDTIKGALGDDQLSGGTGNDIIEGGAGNDTLDGGDDTDVLRGQGGTDTCQNGETLVGCETVTEGDPENFASGIGSVRDPSGGGGLGPTAGGLSPDLEHGHSHGPEREES